MKKRFGLYIIVWSVLVGLFNVITFVPTKLDFQNKFSSSFWIGYVFITLMFIAQLVCAGIALNEGNSKKLFYKLSLFKTSYAGLIASFIVGGICIFFNNVTYWVGIIACAIVLAATVIAIVKASAAVDEVVAIDEKIKNQTYFIKNMTLNASALMAQATSEEAKSACSKVYEAIRYSDPMSNDALREVEDQMTFKFALFSEAVKADEAEKASALAEELMTLIGDRNSRCMLLK